MSRPCSEKYQKGSSTEQDLSTSNIWHFPQSCLSKQGKGKKPVPPSLHLPSDSEQLEMAA